MISMDEFTTIKLLNSKGVSIRQIAKLLKISRNTVRKYLKSSDPPTYQIKTSDEKDDVLLTAIGPSKSKWDKYKEEIADMYYNKKFIGSRIFEELKEKGAEGSLSGFHEYLKKVKNQDIAKKVRARFETGPGKQSQFDWSDYVVRIGDEYRKVYVYQTILCWSRYKYNIGSYNKNQSSIFEAIESAIKNFGGVTEEILTDNARQMVTNPNPKKFEYNQQYVRFLNYYGISPRVCKIRHSWTKGKVENPFNYLEEHFIKGNEFKSLEDFNLRLKEFTDKWNKKKHTGINDIPYQRYISEKEYLKGLPLKRYLGIEVVWKKVSNDCLISYGGNKYSVPYVYAFNHVWVREKLGNQVKIYSQKGKLIAKHQIPVTKGNIITKKEHYEGLIKSTVNSSVYIKTRFMEHFPQQESYLERISAQKRINWKSHVNKILSLIEIYKREDIKKAIQSSIKHNVYSYDYILAYMRENFDIDYQGYTKKILVKNIDIQESIEGIKRSLKAYEEVSDGKI